MHALECCCGNSLARSLAQHIFRVCRSFNIIVFTHSLYVITCGFFIKSYQTYIICKRWISQCWYQEMDKVSFPIALASETIYIIDPKFLRSKYYIKVLRKLTCTSAHDLCWITQLCVILLWRKNLWLQDFRLKKCKYAQPVFCVWLVLCKYFHIRLTLVQVMQTTMAKINSPVIPFFVFIQINWCQVIWCKIFNNDFRRKCVIYCEILTLQDD